MHTRTILDLKPGEAAFTPTHAAWVQGSDMYLNGSYPISPVGQGSFGLRLVKFANGVLAVDLTGCAGERFSSIPAFCGDVPKVRVDRALEAPLPDPDRRRLFDLKPGEFGFVSTKSASLSGPHMWLNGLATVVDVASGENPLLVERFLDGSYVIDSHFCQDALYQRAPFEGTGWPIQVLRAIQSRRIQH